MKRFLAVVLGISFLSGCSEKDPDEEAMIKNSNHLESEGYPKDGQRR